MGIDFDTIQIYDISYRSASVTLTRLPRYYLVSGICFLLFPFSDTLSRVFLLLVGLCTLLFLFAELR